MINSHNIGGSCGCGCGCGGAELLMIVVWLVVVIIVEMMALDFAGFSDLPKEYLKIFIP